MIIWVTGVRRKTIVGDWRFDNLCGSYLQTSSWVWRWLPHRLSKRLSPTTPSQDSSHPDDHFQSRCVTPGFKPFPKKKGLSTIKPDFFLSFQFEIWFAYFFANYRSISNSSKRQSFSSGFKDNLNHDIRRMVSGKFLLKKLVSENKLVLFWLVKS